MKELRLRLNHPTYRQRLKDFLSRETAVVVNKKVEQISGLKGWLVRTFGSKDIENTVDEVPTRVLAFLEELVTEESNSSLWTMYAEMIERISEFFWTIQLSEIMAWLPKAVRDRALVLSFAAAREPQNQKALSSSAAVLLQILLGELQKPDSDLSLSKNLRELLDRPDSSLAVVIDKSLAKSFELLKAYKFTSVRSLFGGKDLSDFFFFEVLQQYLFAKVSSALPSLAQHFPVEEKLMELWNSMSNAEIKAAVDRALGQEFKGLVNAGISLGAIVAFGIYLFQSSMVTLLPDIPPIAGMVVFLLIILVVAKFGKFLINRSAD